MLAVIKTGGKQYLVSPGQKIKIEKIEGPASAKASAVGSTKSAFGSTKSASGQTKSASGQTKSAGKQEITFKEVLLLEKNKKLEIGTPLVKGAKVVAKILSQGKSKKVIVFKYKPKTRYKKKAGHRQFFTEVEILKIEH